MFKYTEMQVFFNPVSEERVAKVSCWLQIHVTEI